MKDMHEAEVVLPCEKMQLTYQDGTERQVLFNEEEVPFPEGRLIVSRTDLKGLITHCNQSFVDMSGYSEDELIGEPHHILRHPDMPAAALVIFGKPSKVVRNGMVMSKTCVRTDAIIGCMQQ